MVLLGLIIGKTRQKGFIKGVFTKKHIKKG